jgi:xanthine dehydrogenase accessory factor
VGALSDRDLLAALVAELDAGRPAALATVVDTHRSVPRRPGSRMVVLSDGTTSGSIGGGEMEARVREVAADAMRSGVPARLRYDLVDPGTGDPGVCGGTVELLVEPFLPPPNVLVIGCGHVGRAVVEVAHWAGLRVIAYDDRAELATPSALPLADLVTSGPASSLVSHVNGATAVVVVTRNMAVDLDVLPVVLATPAPYVGVMGSARRWATTREALVTRGVAPDVLDRVTSPIGVEIGAETPQEIAVSILAEVIRVRRQGAT